MRKRYHGERIKQREKRDPERGRAWREKYDPTVAGNANLNDGYRDEIGEYSLAHVRCANEQGDMQNEKE